MIKGKRIISGILGISLALSISAATLTLGTSAKEIESTVAKSQRTIDTHAANDHVVINGRSLFYGDIFTVNGTTYVPMFRFSAWLGKFKYSYDARTQTASITGENLQISAKNGTLYIQANGRYFYTSEAILIKNNEMYVPIKPLVKALNSHIRYDSQRQIYVVGSGDTRLLKSDKQVYNENDIYWLAKIISAEAEGEPMRGKIAVGNVILNRMRSKQFPNTIYGVIFDKKHGVQFAPVSNGTIYKPADAESIIAAKMCYEGYSLSSEILYFVNPKASPSNWIISNRPFAFSLQNHHFFK